MSKMQIVGVYGSLRRGMGNHRLLEGAEFLCTTVTAEPYAMYSLGGFPKVALHGEKVSPIVVELYSCNEDTMRSLDRLEGFRGEGMDNFYDRSTIQTECGKDALIYHIESPNSNPVESGDWVEYRKSGLR